MENRCRCDELPRYRANNEKLWRAKLIVQKLGVSSRMIQYHCSRVGDGAEHAYDSTKTYEIVQNLDTKKRNLESRCNTLDEKIRIKSSQLANALNDMEHEDRQFHLAEAMKRMEEEKKRKRSV